VSAERLLLDCAGLLAGIAILVGLAVAERQRPHAPATVPAIPAPQPAMCLREKASHDVEWQDGRQIVVATHWRRTVREPCWYDEPELPSKPHTRNRP